MTQEARAAADLALVTQEDREAAAEIAKFATGWMMPNDPDSLIADMHKAIADRVERAILAAEQRARLAALDEARRLAFNSVNAPDMPERYYLAEEIRALGAGHKGENP